MLRRFAVDWLQDESVLRMMLGSGGHIICSLAVPSGYPDQGHVTLTSVEGVGDVNIVEVPYDQNTICPGTGLIPSRECLTQDTTYFERPHERLKVCCDMTRTSM